jgi:hypothetical protein
MVFGHPMYLYWIKKLFPQTLFLGITNIYGLFEAAELPDRFILAT